MAPNQRDAEEGHPLVQMILIGVVASIIGTAATLLIDWFPRPASGASDQIDTVYDVLLIASVPIFVLVMTIAIYSVVRFRVRPGDMSDGAPVHGNTRLEIIWVTIPFILVSALAIYGWIVLDDIEAKKGEELQVKVTGQQFTWTFEYPQRVRSTELVLPVSRPVHFRVRTRDVIHSFWVPEFRLKTDAVPGLTTELRVTPSRRGVYEVVCAELCGLGHATMRQNVRVVDEPEFESWLREQRTGGAGGGGGGDATAEGKQIFTASGCGGCHRLADAGTTATAGPSLDELAQVAGRRKRGTSAEAYVRESILDPRAFAVKGFSGSVMPAYRGRLSREEVDALARYLLGVSGGDEE